MTITSLGLRNISELVQSIMQSRLSTLRTNQLWQPFENQQSHSHNGLPRKKSKRYGDLFSINSENFVVKRMSNFKNDYEIIGQLGEGSFGKVYKIQHKSMKLVRALKQIKKDEKSTIKFEEIEILKKLDHFNIIKIYEFYETQNTFLIVTDLFQGRELFEQLQDVDYFSQKIARKIIQEILNALNYCHSLGIAHRDIKAENILVKNLQSLQHLKIKIIDWGIGTKITDKQCDRVCGTPEYAAPQIFKGKYSLQCDMWSLGILTYQLLTGQLPFQGQTIEKTIKLVKKGFTNFKSYQWQSLPLLARQFILDLLQKNPQSRLTAHEAIKHSWIKQGQNQRLVPRELQHTLEHLKNITINNKFCLAVVNFINNHYSLASEKEKLDKVFEYLDANRDGVIELDELKNGYSTLYPEPKATEIAEETFTKLDVNNNGKLEYSEFIGYSIEKHHTNKKLMLKEVFNMLDQDKNGQIDWRQIGAILQNKPSDMQSLKLQELLNQIDKNGDNQLDFKQFYPFLNKVLTQTEGS